MLVSIFLLHHFGQDSDSKNPKPPGLVGSLDEENCSQHVILFVGAKVLGEGNGTSQCNLEIRKLKHCG